MKISEMIEVLQAYERGEQIEFQAFKDVWSPVGIAPSWNFCLINYRIAPKKELSLVEELRRVGNCVRLGGPLYLRAADRIEELEKEPLWSAPIEEYATDELLAEIKRR